ncbi:MAG: hypothetical protein AB7O44_17225 [Hyphomicrobiaceae bacterium]
MIDGFLVAVNRIHHVRQNRIEQLPYLLGIAVDEQLHRALQVGEEYRDLLALAFDGGAGGEYLLRQVLRRVGVRGDGPRRVVSGTNLC